MKIETTHTERILATGLVNAAKPKGLDGGRMNQRLSDALVNGWSTEELERFALMHSRDLDALGVSPVEMDEQTCRSLSNMIKEALDRGELNGLQARPMLRLYDKLMDAIEAAKAAESGETKAD